MLLPVAIALCMAGTARAQGDSGKVIRIISPYAPGGGTDVLAQRAPHLITINSRHPLPDIGGQ